MYTILALICLALNGSCLAVALHEFAVTGWLYDGENRLEPMPLLMIFALFGSGVALSLAVLTGVLTTSTVGG